MSPSIASMLDGVAATALASSGAHLVLFSTGRGTPFACPVPTLKIATNPTLAEHKANWIDFSAGPLLAGVPMAEEAQTLFDYVLQVASGEATKSEKLSKRNLAIFKDGVTL